MMYRQTQNQFQIKDQTNHGILSTLAKSKHTGNSIRSMIQIRTSVTHSVLV